MLSFSYSVNAQNLSLKEKKKYKVVKTDTEWKILLSPLAYYVLRKAGTERPFSSPFND